jgi:hypothetical protein
MFDCCQTSVFFLPIPLSNFQQWSTTLPGVLETMPLFFPLPVQGVVSRLTVLGTRAIIFRLSLKHFTHFGPKVSGSKSGHRSWFKVLSITETSLNIYIYICIYMILNCVYIEIFFFCKTSTGSSQRSRSLSFIWAHY